MTSSVNILYDHQIFSLQNYGGISRYFYELIRNINNELDSKAFNNTFKALTYPFYTNNHYILGSDSFFKSKNFFSNYNFRGKQRLISKINSFQAPKKILNSDFQIFHPTYYDPYFLKYITKKPFVNKKPFVLTIYDMIHEKFPFYFPLNDKTSFNKKILAEKADMVIAISQNTKNDIIRFFNLPEKKIEVVYLGNSFNPVTYADIVTSDNNSNNNNYSNSNNYILFTGCRSNYKNFAFFITAVSRLMKNDETLHIIAAGGGSFNSEETNLIQKLGIKGRVMQTDVTDELLVQLYKKARAFVFPSMYEGFGIPVLESFSCSCPLVCSNQGSLPEIAGSGAAYFDPCDQDSLIEALKNVIYNDQIRAGLIAKGKKELQKYSWHLTAEKTLKIYEKIM
jgi:glycosyltransferase involved in cell wall biosynthesis